MIENTKNVLPIHITGMENIKGQQTINSVLDSMNNEIDNHKWIITTQDYANLRFEKYIESGATFTVDQKPKANIPVVGTHNNRKVYIGDLDVQGNLIISNLALRDNINTISKSWEHRSEPEKSEEKLEGDWWDNESYRVCIRDKKTLVEVKSIPNDIKDTMYGDTIYNGEASTPYGTSIDTRTYEKNETSYFIAYPYILEEGMKEPTIILEKWKKDDWMRVNNPPYFPQITTKNAKDCWSLGQYYGIFDWENGPEGKVKLIDYKYYGSYDEFYKDVEAYPSTNGASGRGIMIPSWRAIKLFYEVDCALYSFKVDTRRIISEEFDKRNSGIVKVDVAYRI